MAITEPELSDQAFAMVESYLHTPGDASKDTYGFLLALVLLNSILKEYQHLRLGDEKDIALAAWACRSLRHHDNTSPRFQFLALMVVLALGMSRSFDNG
jgi:hypothetical protein